MALPMRNDTQHAKKPEMLSSNLSSVLSSPQSGYAYIFITNQQKQEKKKKTHLQVLLILRSEAQLNAEAHLNVLLQTPPGSSNAF